ncbi:predicted protein [Histoplasma capsulatum H143]|uniref:Uncharacterized protein n=1 Tax=Ajellomyces capsulatus (strain H143) TaxID=544712 RepID=C6HRT5_AJECH|nr:predicted protein [Histoplasma capsulatum H143]
MTGTIVTPQKLPMCCDELGEEGDALFEKAIQHDRTSQRKYLTSTTVLLMSAPIHVVGFFWVQFLDLEVPNPASLSRVKSITLEYTRISTKEENSLKLAATYFDGDMISYNTRIMMTTLL